MAFPIPSSGLSVVALKEGSLRLFYQLPGGPIGQSIHVNGWWSHDPLDFSAVPLSPLASVTWNEGQEIRVYYLDSGYTIQEHCFSEGKGWYPGDIGTLGAKATPVSRLGAVVYHDLKGRHIRVYYQEHGSNHVVEICHDGEWHSGGMSIEDAVWGTGIAAVTYAGGGFIQIRVYYQSIDELGLKEYCHNEKGWLPGEFRVGKAQFRTPICAIGLDGAQIQVFWREPDSGNVACTTHTDSWTTKVIREIGPGFELTVLEWGQGKFLRLYYQTYNSLLLEYCSDHVGDTWFAGQKITNTN